MNEKNKHMTLADRIEIRECLVIGWLISITNII